MWVSVLYALPENSVPHSQLMDLDRHPYPEPQAIQQSARQPWYAQAPRSLSSPNMVPTVLKSPVPRTLPLPISSQSLLATSQDFSLLGEPEAEALVRAPVGRGTWDEETFRISSSLSLPPCLGGGGGWRWRLPLGVCTNCWVWQKIRWHLGPFD